MTILQVRLETIKYGGWDSLEVAVDVNQMDGKILYLTYPTAETILNYRVNSFREKLSSKSLETFIGKSLVQGKRNGNVVNKRSEGTPKVALVELDDFLGIATWEAVINRNIEVGKILAVGFGDSLRSLAYEQLGIKLSEENRQVWLMVRLEGMVVRKSLTKIIEEYCEKNPVSDKYKQFVFVHVSDKLNRAMFGKAAKQLCEERGCDRNILRETHTALDLKQIEYIENYAVILIDRQNIEPKQAIQQAIDFHLPSIN